MSAAFAPSAPKPPDRRARRTRAAILVAFNRLVLKRGFAGLSPSLVATEADVGRSTFYEHFHGLEDLLAQALAPIIAPLADACFKPTSPDDAAAVVEHLWTNRRLARRLLTGATRQVVLRAFSERIGAALMRELKVSCVARLRVEPELIALSLAAAQLELLGAWLGGRSKRSAQEVADALHAGGRGLVGALAGVG